MRKKKPMKRRKRSSCPIACSMDLLGDRWSLLLVRDMLFLGKKTYKEFHESPEGIPTNVLADRLKRFEDAGLVTRERYEEHPPRHAYQPTRMCIDLFPAVKALVDWGNKYFTGTYVPVEELRVARARFDSQVQERGPSDCS